MRNSLKVLPDVNCQSSNLIVCVFVFVHQPEPRMIKAFTQYQLLLQQYEKFCCQCIALDELL